MAGSASVFMGFDFTCEHLHERWQIEIGQMKKDMSLCYILFVIIQLANYQWLSLTFPLPATPPSSHEYIEV